MARTAASPAGRLAGAPRRPVPGRLLAVAWLAFLALLVALTLAAAEVGLHLRRDRVAAHLPDPPPTDDRFVPDRLLGYLNRPSYSYRSENRYHQSLRYANNALGLRGPETSLEKPPGRRRVLVVGASTVYGALDDQADTLPAQLEALLHTQPALRDVEVLNGGVAGFDAMREAAYTRARLLALRPDVIVVMDGLNDVFYGSLEEWPAQVAENELRVIADGHLPDLVAATDRTMFPDGLLAHQVAMLARNTRLAVYRRVGVDVAAPRVASDRVVALHAASVGLIADYGRAAGASVVASLQPLLVLGDKALSEEEQASVLREDYWDPQGWPAVARLMYPRMDATTRAAVESAGGTYLDLRHAFDAETDTTYAEDVAHYTALGNRRLAEAVLPRVRVALGG